ncbi:MAG TPA: sugar ABC transporter substrate-binding protein [Actinomycetaceae bacterium]|nr:sugar ABC transporter substrate-binding protein [Actinomycetaceae bacterium]
MSQQKRTTVGATALSAALVLTACSGAGGGGGGDAVAEETADSINVIMVNNPQMVDLQELTEEHFTAETGITVNYTVLPENDVRDRISQEFSSQSGQYDVATISNYEVPIFGTNEWLAPLDEFAEGDAEFALDDILGPITESMRGPDGDLFGIPFYGESSFTMYRTDVFDELGLTMPDNPTWEEIAELAEQVHTSDAGMAGICLRGLPGWGQIFAPLTTVVNTFGGTWVDEDWNPQVNAPEFVEATEFYVDLVTSYGQSGAAQSGFTECLNNMTQGETSMWYDATSAAGSLEADGSPVQGNIGYAPAPVKETETAGWLYAWSWGVQAASERKDAAWEFISWASSQEYEELVGAELGWSRVPAGKRASTYDNPDYLEVAGAFAEPTLRAIEAARPTDPGLQPRPVVGIQFMAFPEFADLATRVSEDVSSAIAGQLTVQEALDAGQATAESVLAHYQE